MEVAHYDNLSLWEFDQTPDWYQDLMVQAYRTKNQIQTVLHEDQRIKDDQRAKMQEARRMSSI